MGTTVAGETVVLTLTASGSVSDYSDTSSLQQSIATVLNIDKSLVTIRVATGSVIITATIAVPAKTSPAALTTSLSSSLGTAAAASAALGITVELAPTVVSGGKCQGWYIPLESCNESYPYTATDCQGLCNQNINCGAASFASGTLGMFGAGPLVSQQICASDPPRPGCPISATHPNRPRKPPTTNTNHLYSQLLTRAAPLPGRLPALPAPGRLPDGCIHHLL